MQLEKVSESIKFINEKFEEAERKQKEKEIAKLIDLFLENFY